MELNTCALCLQHRPLCDSHIIPELAFQHLYDDKHRAIDVVVDSGHKSWMQKGYREPLLCKDCENHISKFERYFSQVWNESGAVPAVLPNGVNEWRLSGLDYAQLKLFHLSILWRAAASKLAQYGHIRLGPHFERIRGMLISSEPGPPSRYGMWGNLVFYPKDRRIVWGIIPSPRKVRYKAHHVYNFMFAGCSWNYVVSSHMSLHLGDLNPRPGADLLLRALDIDEATVIRREFEEHTRNAQPHPRKLKGVIDP